MEIDKRLAVLDRLYDVYDDFIRSQGVACSEGCAHCCTRNVSMTTLEGYRMLRRLPEKQASGLISTLQAAAGRPRFKPAITINHMAELCTSGREIPEETIDPMWGPCPVLTEDTCPIYALRPFGCRCMVSGRTCSPGGDARMDPFVVTVNAVCQQTIEHIDLMGCTGNFIDILTRLGSAADQESYRAGRLVCRSIGLLPNRPLKVLMVPPEHRTRIQPVLDALKKI